MRIRTKMGLSFLVIGLAFLTLLIFFIYLSSSLDILRQERSKVDQIQIEWNQAAVQLYRTLIDPSPENVRSDWERQVSNLDNQLQLFLSSQMSVHDLKEGEPHYENLQSMVRAWETIQEEFIKIGLLLDQVDTEKAPLLTAEPDPILNELSDSIIFFTPFRDLFQNTLMDTIQYIDDELARRSLLFRRINLILSGLTILISVIFSAVFARRIAGRITKVQDAVAAVSRGDFTARLDLRTQDEFGALSQNFNTFIQELKNRLALGFRAMYRLNHALSSDAGSEQIYLAVATAALEISGADAAAICIWKAGEAGRAGEHELYTQGNFPRRLLDLDQAGNLCKLLTRGEHPVLSPIDPEPEDVHARLAASEKVISLAAHPLIHSDQRIGAVVAVRRSGSELFNDLDLFHLEHFSEFGALTLENSLQSRQIEKKRQLDREMDLAASIQKRLIPQKVPQLAHVRVAFHSQPAGAVGGDYFDLLRLPKDRLALIVCDVAGKGLPASLVMVMIRTILHIIGPAAKDAGTIVNYINSGLVGSLEPGIFATLSFLVIDLKTNQAEYVNAGHLPALLASAESGTVRPIDSGGLPVGLEAGTRYSALKLDLSAGDTLLLYSDGISEAAGKLGGMYSQERLNEVFTRSIGMDAENIKRSIMSDLSSFAGGGPLSDDQTLVVVKTV